MVRIGRSQKLECGIESANDRVNFLENRIPIR